MTLTMRSASPVGSAMDLSLEERPLTALALLCQKLQVSLASQQYVTLRQLQQRWQLFEQAQVTVLDCKELLILLFHMISRRSSDSVRERNEFILASETAFEVLHLIFGKPTGQHFTIFLEALKALLEELELTEENLYQQPPPPPQDILRQLLLQAAGQWRAAEKEAREPLELEETRAWRALQRSFEEGAVLAGSKAEVEALEIEHGRAHAAALQEEERAWHSILKEAFRLVKGWESIGLRIGDTTKDHAQVDAILPGSQAERLALELSDAIKQVAGQLVKTAKEVLDVFSSKVDEGGPITVQLSRLDLEALLGLAVEDVEEAGVVVKEVSEGGVAHRAGLQAGDQVVYVRQTKVTEVAQFQTSCRWECRCEDNIPVMVRRPTNDEVGFVDLKFVMEVTRDANPETKETVVEVQLVPIDLNTFIAQLNNHVVGLEGPEGMHSNPDGIPSYEELKAQAEEEIAEDQRSAWPSEKQITLEGDVKIDSRSFHLDVFLEHHDTRAACVQTLRTLDLSGVNTRFFISLDTGHLYLQHRFTSRAKVFRDFIQCTPLPRYNGSLSGRQKIHIKTNIKAKSDIMYRLAVEGYNYGNNSIINCDAVGYTHHRWEQLGKSEEYGWPEGWDAETIHHYAPGVTLSQYYSSDGFVTLRLEALSFFSVGFSVSAWLTSHTFGCDFLPTATIHQQDADV